MKKIISRLIFGFVIIAFVSILFNFSDVSAKSCAGVNTSIIECSSEGGEGAIGNILGWVINILCGLIGVTAVAFVIFSGYQYMTSGGDPTKMAKAKNRIVQILIGLIIFTVMWGALNFFIPGGLFNVASRQDTSEEEQRGDPGKEVKNVPVEL